MHNIKKEPHAFCLSLYIIYKKITPPQVNSALNKQWLYIPLEIILCVYNEAAPIIKKKTKNSTTNLIYPPFN